MKTLRSALMLPVLFLLTFFSTKSFAQGVTDLTLDGTVGKYPVVMEIQVWSYGPTIVGGVYYYKSQGPNKKIALSDDLNIQNGNGCYPQLQESVNGKVTGTFHASYWDVKTMRGTWISADGSKQLPFSLKVIKSDHHYIE